jgi:taurine dioxygenase
MSIDNIILSHLTSNIGVEIEGVDLAGSLSDAVLDAIYSALVEHQVIFFRDQNMSPENHIEFAKTFGELDVPHLVYPHVEGFERIVKLENDANNPPDTDVWHTDLTFMANPPFASILIGREIPTVGGDTLWASMYAAYDALSDDMKSHVGKLKAIHDMGSFKNDFTVGETTTERLMEGFNKFGATIHDVVKTHPVSGRKYLYVNEGFTAHIVGMTGRDSRQLLNLLLDHISKPEFQVRFKWREGSVAMWDNRCTQHYAIADYMPNYRCMNRVTVVKDRRS